MFEGSGVSTGAPLSRREPFLLHPPRGSAQTSRPLPEVPLVGQELTETVLRAHCCGKAKETKCASSKMYLSLKMTFVFTISPERKNTGRGQVKMCVNLEHALPGLLVTER